MLKDINTIVKEIDEKIEHINCGGCCVFAESIYPYLDELGLEPKIKVIEFGGSSSDLTIIRKKMKNSLSLREWNANGVYFNHVAVQFTYRKRVYIVDSTGVFIEAKFQYVSEFLTGYFSRAEARSFSKDESGWNYWFERSNISEIKKGLKKGFKLSFPYYFETVNDISYK